MKAFQSICIIAGLLLLGFTSTATAQTSPIFEKYGDKNHVKSVYISKTMLEAQPHRIAQDLNLNVVNQLDAVFMVSTNTEDIKKNMRSDIENYIKKGKYEVLMKQKSTVSSSSIYVRKKGDKVKELIMFTDAVTLTFLHLFGDMTLADIQNITRDQYGMMGIPAVPMLSFNEFFDEFGGLNSIFECFYLNR